MKKVLLTISFFFCLLSSQLLMAQATASINVTIPGTFASQLVNAGFIPAQVTALTVTGNLNDADIQFMNSNLTSLMNLNLKEASLANNAFPSNAFSNKTTLVSVSIPKNIVGIGSSNIYSVFSGCSKLANIDLTGCNSLKTIGASCFSQCSSLISIDLTVCPALESIQDGAFRYCGRLKNIILPASLISLAGFSGCDSLQTVDITRCVALKTIDYFTFNGDSQLQNIDFTSCISLEAIEGRVFERNQSLKKLDFSKCTSLVSFDNNLYGCTGLQEVILPSSMASLSSTAFSSCSSLQKLTVMRNIPPTLQGNSTFTGVPQNTCKLIIPSGSKTAYMTAAQWGNFVNIEEVDFPNISTLYNMQVTFDSNGSVNSGQTPLTSGSNLQVEKDNTVAFNIYPNYNYTVGNILFNNTDVTLQVKEIDGVFIFTTPAITATSILTVTFKQKPVILTIKSAETGSIGLDLVKNSTQKIFISPSTGWVLYSVNFNSSDVTNQLINSSYTTPSLSSNSTIDIVFKQIVNSSVAFSKSKSVQFRSNAGTLTVYGVPIGKTITIHNLNGVILQTTIATDNETMFNLRENQIYIVKVDGEGYKLLL